MTFRPAIPLLQYANRVFVWITKWEVDLHNMEMHIVIGVILNSSNFLKIVLVRFYVTINVLHELLTDLEDQT